MYINTIFYVITTENLYLRDTYQHARYCLYSFVHLYVFSSLEAFCDYEGE